MAYSGGAGVAAPPRSQPQRPAIRDPLARPQPLRSFSSGPPVRVTNRNRPGTPPPRNNQPQQGHTGAAAHVNPIANTSAPAPHRRGGGGSIPTNPLAPLTPQQIRQQASKTVGAAYGGDFKDLNNQRQQAQNLFKTQSADDAAFAKWLTTQTQSMQAQTDTVNQKLADTMNGILQTQQQALGALPGQLAGQIQGTGTAPGQLQAAATSASAPAINAANAETAAAAEREAVQVGVGNTSIVNAGQVAQGRISQAKAAEFDTLSKSLQSIASERSKLLVSRTGDIAKEIARLQGVEISKAQYNQSQAALEQKLGISKITAQAGVTRAKTGQYNAITSRQRAEETARHNSAMEKINSTHYTDQAAHQRAVAQETARHNAVTEAIGQTNAATAQQRAANAAANAGKGTQLVNGRPVKIASAASQRTTRNLVGSVKNALLWDIQHLHRGDPDALNKARLDLENGTYQRVHGAKQKTDPNTGKPVTVPGPALPVNVDTGFINAASNLLTQYGALGLSPGDVAFLETQGLSNLGGYYPIHNRGADARNTQGGIGHRG
jgi:hypothetical protein